MPDIDSQACRDEISKWWRLEAHADNASLLLDRFLRVAVKDKKDHPKARKQLFDKMVDALPECSEVYEAAYIRHVLPFKDLKSKGLFKTSGRMIIGLGGENVLETGLTLNRIYGAPMIPGTALKGLAAHYCDRAWGASDDKFKRDGECYQAIFGTTDDSGHIIFHDAWITPESLVGTPESLVRSLVPDVMTPHHGNYYSDKGGTVPPTDFDDPKPVTFLSVHGTFCVAVSCDVPGPVGDEWASRVFGLLSDALKEWGIGGKTNSGYGRLQATNGDVRPGPAASGSTEVSPAGQDVVVEKKPDLPRPKYKKGDVISVTREADPNVKRGRPYFKADDGIGGFVQHGAAPSIEIGMTTRLEVTGISEGKYVFSALGSREASSKEKSKRRSKGGRR